MQWITTVRLPLIFGTGFNCEEYDENQETFCRIIVKGRGGSNIVLVPCNYVNVFLYLLLSMYQGCGNKI